MITHDVNGDFYKGNRVEQEFFIKAPNPDTGELEPASALTDIYIWVSATDGGAPLNLTLKKPATMRAGNPGHWFAPFSGLEFDPILFPLAEPLLYHKKRLWVILRDEEGNINRSVPRMAYALRSI